MTRWIQAWNHAGSSHLIHAIPDDAEQRHNVRLGRLGIYAKPVCYKDNHSRFMRLASAPSDAPTYTEEGWLDYANPAGRDWASEEAFEADRKCHACTRVLRSEQVAK